MCPVQPDQEGGRAEEVHGDVRDPEQRRQSLGPSEPRAEPCARRRVQVALERDDPVGVLAGDAETVA